MLSKAVVSKGLRVDRGMRMAYMEECDCGSRCVCRVMVEDVMNELPSMHDLLESQRRSR